MSLVCHAGKTPNNRSAIGSPVFRELFRELPAVDGVIVSAIDRLVHPNQLGDLAVFDPFQAQGKKIWTPAGETDLGTDSGFMSSAFTGVMAGLERRMLLARTLAGKEALRRQGRHVIGPQSLPRGIAYDKASARWSYREPDYSRIRQAYELLFRGESWQTIAEAVGGGWSSVGLRRTLLNPVWKGLRVYPAGMPLSKSAYRLNPC
jgi:DNA invertase Pin-like site-specific DNA recombinase